MSIFKFEADRAVGRIVRVDTTRAWARVESPERLREARVGRLVAAQGRDATEWIVGIIDRVWRNPLADVVATGSESGGDLAEPEEGAGWEPEENGLAFVMLGTYRARIGDEDDAFTRAILTLPCVDEQVHAIEGASLEAFMRIVSREAQDQEGALDIGVFTLDPAARAYVDANKLLQRHAALVGTTGTGKSWTVAALLEQTAPLPNCNVIVFDIHGEYASLDYAEQFRIAGPADLGGTAPEVLYLPYWLLAYEEMEAMFIDRSAFTAHNQAIVLRDTVENEKRRALEQSGKTDVLASFTIDSPVPYDIDAVVSEIERLNQEMVEGSSGKPKQGPFYGDFTRFLVRLRSKMADRRYGFMYHLPPEWHRYEALHHLAQALLGHGTGARDSSPNPGLKVVDFSEVPSDVLPVMVSLVARLVFQVQFWSASGSAEDPRHPVLLVCDEAHVYLPSREEASGPLERRAIESFERIAKEGRKYGIGLLVVSQRPADVSATILSQCSNFVALRLANSQDQAVVRRLMPESLGALLDVLPALDIGEAIVVGDAILLPTRVKLRKPTTKPLSKTIDFWTEWRRNDVAYDLAAAVENLRRQCRTGT